MDKLVTELYEQMKEIEEGYVEWEKTCQKELIWSRIGFFVSLIVLSILIFLCVPGVIENIWGNTWKWIIIGATLFFIALTVLAYKIFNKKFKEIPTKFDIVCTNAAKMIKEVYGDNNASKFIDLLISDLTNKKSTALKIYDNTIKAVTSLPMLVATTALGFILKGGFESKFSESDLNLIFGISFLILLFKIVSHGIVSTINNPIWGKSYKETYLLRVLQIAKYEVLKK